MTKQIYTVTQFGGKLAGLVAAESAEDARNTAECFGTWNIARVEPSTDEEIDWVRAMGGYVPDLQRINA